MTTAAAELDRALAPYLGDGAFAVEGGRALYMEVTDRGTGLVWMTPSPVTPAEFEALVVEPPITKTGIGFGPMDRAVFRSSPGAPEEPVLERAIGGRTWINVAQPLEIQPPTKANGPARVTVDKEHVIGFEAGRRVSILRLPAGDYVELVGEASHDAGRVLPDGGVLEQIELQEPWVVVLPNPTDAWFWFSDGMRSFQGPVTLPPTP